MPGDVRVCVCIRVCLCICVRARVCVGANVHMWVLRVSMHDCLHAFVRARVSSCIRVRVSVCASMNGETLVTGSSSYLIAIASMRSCSLSDIQPIVYRPNVPMA